MAHVILFQPWTTLGGNANTLIQNDSDWLDLAGYKAIAVHLQVASVSNTSVTTTLSLQSSPTRDEVFFTTGSAAASWAFPASGTGMMTITRISYPTLRRFLRWSVTFGAAAVAMTFRMGVTLLPAGW